jgi:prepilin-type processing-associated H-X9-DG protein
LFGLEFLELYQLPIGVAHQPVERHGHGANLSFLDGHVQAHRWLFTPKRFIDWNSSPTLNSLDEKDLELLYDRSHLGQYRLRVLGLPWP